jgi:heptaprenyl diphosphate synthase
MDDATTRRTVPSVNARWGNLKAILAGDYLLAKASEIAASLGTEVAGLLAATIGRLCEGQILELQHAFDLDRTEEAYLASIDGKTASLLGTACRVGSIVAGLPRQQIDALTTFGRGFGMAFQIVDDLLDVTSTDEELGKPAGHDLVEGTYTLPVIRTLAAGDHEADELRSLLVRLQPADGSIEPVDDPDTLTAARVLLRSSAAVRASLDTARPFVEEGPARAGPVRRHRGGNRARSGGRTSTRHSSCRCLTAANGATHRPCRRLTAANGATHRPCRRLTGLRCSSRARGAGRAASATVRCAGCGSRTA